MGILNCEAGLPLTVEVGVEVLGVVCEVDALFALAPDPDATDLDEEDVVVDLFPTLSLEKDADFVLGVDVAVDSLGEVRGTRLTDDEGLVLEPVTDTFLGTEDLTLVLVSSSSSSSSLSSLSSPGLFRFNTFFDDVLLYLRSLEAGTSPLPSLFNLSVLTFLEMNSCICFVTFVLALMSSNFFLTSSLICTIAEDSCTKLNLVR